jgi:hypothetical protein
VQVDAEAAGVLARRAAADEPVVPVLVHDIPDARAVEPEPPADGERVAVGGGVDPQFVAGGGQFAHQVCGAEPERLARPPPEQPRGAVRLAKHAGLVADEGVVEVE